MAINFAEKYASIVDERFTKASVTQSAFNQDLDFTGVNTVNVYSLPTAPMNNYSMAGDNRYGTPDELGDTVQTFTLTQDRSFTFTIDRRNYLDTQMVKESGRALRRQLDEVVIPEVDKYRISILAANAGNTSTPAPITQANAYESFLLGVETLLDNKAPTAGTFAFISTGFYRYIRLDTAFIQASDMAQNMLITGQVGMIENIPIIFVSKSYMPAGAEFLLTNRIAAWAAQKIADYKIHDNPPGINGWLIEGRIYHDCGVFQNKAPAIYVHKSI